MCCVCSGGSCGAGFCVDNVQGLVACANFCICGRLRQRRLRLGRRLRRRLRRRQPCSHGNADIDAASAEPDQHAQPDSDEHADHDRLTHHADAGNLLPGRQDVRESHRRPASAAPGQEVLGRLRLRGGERLHPLVVRDADPDHGANRNADDLQDANAELDADRDVHRHTDRQRRPPPAPRPPARFPNRRTPRRRRRRQRCAASTRTRIGTHCTNTVGQHFSTGDVCAGGVYTTPVPYAGCQLDVGCMTFTPTGVFTVTPTASGTTTSTPTVTPTLRGADQHRSVQVLSHQGRPPRFVSRDVTLVEQFGNDLDHRPEAVPGLQPEHRNEQRRPRRRRRAPRAAGESAGAHSSASRSRTTPSRMPARNRRDARHLP